MPLTDTAIRNAKPRGKPRRLYDADGLYAEIAPTGGKWFRLKYRFNGKEKRISLGVYPDVSLKDARDRRDAARKLLANGIDPSRDRKRQKFVEANQAASTFETVTREWFEEEFGRLGSGPCRPQDSPIRAGHFSGHWQAAHCRSRAARCAGRFAAHRSKGRA